MFAVNVNDYRFNESDTLDKLSDSLKFYKLDFRILDTNNFKQYHIENTHYRNLLIIENNDGDKYFAYYKDNKWILFSLPSSDFKEDHSIYLITAKFVKLDKIENKFLDIRIKMCQGGTHFESGIEEMVLINMDSVPTQIFKVIYYWYEQDRGIGSNGYHKEYQREIEIKDNKIILGTLNKKKYDSENYHLTEIPAGIYIWDGGKIIKKK